MSLVYTALHRHVPFLVPVCKILEDNIYQPALKGEDLSVNTLGDAGSKSLLSRVLEALEAKPTATSAAE